MKEYKKLLNPDGAFVAVGDAKQGIIRLFASVTSRKITFHANPIAPQKDYLSYGKQLTEAGKLVPFIDKVYSVQNITAAIRYIITQHAQGKVEITIDFRNGSKI